MKRKKPRKIKAAVRSAAAVLSLMLCISTFFVDLQAAESKWDIDNTLDVTECMQKEAFMLSVMLKAKGTAKTQEISSLSGVLEYDTSLFTVGKEDILPAAEGAQKCTFNPEDGSFSIEYASDVTVKDAGQLLSIRLHVASDATVGKTTVCVTNMSWSSADGKQKEEIEHRVPARITILKTDEAAPGDVNGDGQVDLIDARMVMQHYNGELSLDGGQLKSADANGDGKVNLMDVKLIMQYYNGEID